jgi:predicted kinase
VTRLVVIAGPANSGKMPLAQTLVGKDRNLLMVHRDQIRSSLANPIHETDLTLALVEMVNALLALGLDVVTVAQNLHPDDQERWRDLADKRGAELQWLDTREPDVYGMIPPLEGWQPACCVA